MFLKFGNALKTTLRNFSPLIIIVFQKALLFIHRPEILEFYRR